MPMYGAADTGINWMTDGRAMTKRTRVMALNHTVRDWMMDFMGLAYSHHLRPAGSDE